MEGSGRQGAVREERGRGEIGKGWLDMLSDKVVNFHSVLPGDAQTDPQTDAHVVT